ncbi:MAG TPA: LysM peptidoglycan-binding domain-containing protein, partial [Anaerolineales bacterium]|nr:LysM peptidoglycan-binding domain-containing protein [Anaerolineales bacterium]
TALIEDNEAFYNNIDNPQPGESLPLTVRWTSQGDSYRLRWVEEDILYEINAYSRGLEMEEDVVREAMVLMALSMAAPEQINFPWNASHYSYTIQTGDTCTALAEQFFTTVETIIELNNLSDNCEIIQGQTLTLSTPGEPFATTDLNCDGKNEALLLLRNPDDLTQILGLALDVTSEANITHRVWEFTASEMGAPYILYEPELFSVGECEQFIAVHGGDPSREGQMGAYRTRIFRWNGTSVWPIMDTGGWPASEDGLIATLPQSSDNPFTIMIIQYALKPHPSTGLCPNLITEFTWNGQRFDKGQTKVISGECLEK